MERFQHYHRSHDYAIVILLLTRLIFYGILPMPVRLLTSPRYSVLEGRDIVASWGPHARIGRTPKRAAKKTMADTTTDNGKKTKITSISLPTEWWETLKRLATLREVQGDVENRSFNAVLVETLQDGMGDKRLELKEREGRKRK